MSVGSPFLEAPVPSARKGRRRSSQTRPIILGAIVNFAFFGRPERKVRC